MLESGAAAEQQVRPRLERFANALAGLGTWRGAAMAVAFGGLSVGALPPIFAVPLLWLAFPGLLWLLDGAPGRARAFLIGWAFGLGYFAAGLYWVGHAFLVDADRFGALMPLAVGALAAGLALFLGLTTLIVWVSKSRGANRVLVLATAWVFCEWIRSWALTGFPWNPIGSVWVFSDAAIQLASVTGVWGLSLVTIIAAAAPACLSEPGSRRRRWGMTGALALGLPLLMWGFGAVRLGGAPAIGTDTVEGTLLRVVQPNIEQHIKWHPDLRAKHVAGQMGLSSSLGPEPPTHVVWSETAVPFLLPDTVQIREAVAKIVPPGGVLLTGAPRRGVVEGAPRLWNSLFAIDEDGAVAAVYDKRHLVPFGEYVPLRTLLPFVKLTEGGGDFSPGDGSRSLRLPGLPEVSALICYEVIFPGRVVDDGSDAKWLLNVTNDAWFGTSTGPYQHFAAARLRAVEEGLPLIRAANTGISAVVDAYGRVVERVELNRVGVIDASLPMALEGKTLFARFGNWTLLILLGFASSLPLTLRALH